MGSEISFFGNGNKNDHQETGTGKINSRTGGHYCKECWTLVTNLQIR